MQQYDQYDPAQQSFARALEIDLNYAPASQYINRKWTICFYVEMTFDDNRDGIFHLYTITSLVKGRKVHIFESAGETDKVAGDLPEIRKAIDTKPMM